MTDHMICQNQDNHLLYALKHGRFWFWDKHQNKWVPSDFAAQQYAKAQTKEPDLTQEDWLGRCFGILKDDYEVPDAVVKSPARAVQQGGTTMPSEHDCPECGCCCDYGRPCCHVGGGNIDHPDGCKQLPAGPLLPLRALLLQCQACPMRKLPVRQRSLIIRGWMPKPLPTCTWPNRCTHRDASWPKWACAAWRMAFPLRTTHCASPLRQNVAMVRGRFPTAKKTFGSWCESVGLNRKAAERLLQVAKLFDSSSPRQQQVLEELSPSLLYAAAKPSAPADLVQAVKSGDITTHKQYQDLLKENQQLRADRVNALNAAAAAEAARDAALADVDGLHEQNRQLQAAATGAQESYRTAHKNEDSALRRATEAEQRAKEAEARAADAEKNRRPAAGDEHRSERPPQGIGKPPAGCGCLPAK